MEAQQQQTKNPPKEQNNKHHDINQNKNYIIENNTKIKPL